MSRNAFRGLLKLASEQMPQGIYAVERKDTAQLLPPERLSRTQLKARRRDYLAQGYKVYANGI